MSNIVGSIYILTNPSFPEYVKIGYADNVNDRVAELNRTECTPFAFRLYAYYDVTERLQDIEIHRMIDKINAELRSIDYVDGKERKREFYKMCKEDAYNIFSVIANLSNTIERLHLADDDTTPVQDDDEELEISEIKYDINKYLSNKNTDIINLYQMFIEKMQIYIKDCYPEATPNYIALRHKQTQMLCEIHLRKNHIDVHTKKPIDKQLQIGEQFPDSYMWSKNYRVRIFNIDDIEIVSKIILDVYNQFLCK